MDSHRDFSWARLFPEAPPAGLGCRKPWAACGFLGFHCWQRLPFTCEGTLGPVLLEWSPPLAQAPVTGFFCWSQWMWMCGHQGPWAPVSHGGWGLLQGGVAGRFSPLSV